MTTVSNVTLLSRIVEHLEQLESLAIDNPVAEIMDNVDCLVDQLWIVEPGASKVRVNWMNTLHDRINLHVYVLNNVSNIMALYQVILTPGFTTYKMDVAYYNSFGSSHPSSEWRSDMHDTIMRELRQQLG